MRGKVIALKASCSSFGITPAYAGKREAALRELGLSEDHPRICGEKIEPSFAFRAT